MTTEILRHQRIDLVPVSDVQGYDRNARRHTDDQIAKLADAIREFGWTAPLLVNEDRVLIAGHGRLAAAKRLGLSEVPVIVIAGLTESKFKAMVIADNALALYGSSWDDRLLAEELRSIQDAFDAGDFDMSLTGLGFTDEDLKAYAEILAPEPVPEEERSLTLTDEPCVVRAGETWMCGPHRLTIAGASANDLRAADAWILAWERQTKTEASLAGGGPTFKARAAALGIEFKRQDTKAQKARLKAA